MKNSHKKLKPGTTALVIFPQDDKPTVATITSVEEVLHSDDTTIFLYGATSVDSSKRSERGINQYYVFASLEKYISHFRQERLEQIGHDIEELYHTYSHFLKAASTQKIKN